MNDCDIEVWRPTPAEWDEFIQQGLSKLGISSYEDLARQALERDFQSSQARDFWVVIGGRGSAS